MFYGLGLLLLWGTVAQAADYQITVTLNAEEVAYLQRRYPNATAAQIRAKIGDVCTQRITRDASQDIETTVGRVRRLYLDGTPEQKTAIRTALEGIQ
jgi:uncharacterized protein YijF (DUF1287 family)